MCGWFRVHWRQQTMDPSRTGSRPAAGTNQTSRVNSSFERRRPRVGQADPRRSRGRRTRSSSPASSAPRQVRAPAVRPPRPRAASARVQPQGQDHGLGGGIRRASISSDAARRQRPAPRRLPAPAPPGTRPAAPRSSGGSTPSNACAPGPTASYGRRVPVDEVVPALVPGPRPVRDLVAAEPGRTQPLDRQPVLLGRAVLVLLRGSPSPASDGRPARVGRWSPERPGQPLVVRVVQRQGVRGDVVGRQGKGGVQRRRPRVRRTGPARRTGGPARRTRSPPARASASAVGHVRRPVPPAQARAAAPRPSPAPPATAGSPRPQPARAHRRARPDPGSTRSSPRRPSAIPNRARTRSRSRATASDGSSVGRPAAQVHGLERRAARRGSAGAPNGERASAASARSEISASAAPPGTPPPGRPARAPPPPRTRRSRSTGRARRRTERGRRARPAGTRRWAGPRRRTLGRVRVRLRRIARLGSAIPAVAARAGRARASRRASAAGARPPRSSVPLRLRQPGVPGGREDRDARDRVPQERGSDAARHAGQPAAGEADQRAPSPACTTAAPEPRAASPARTAAPVSRWRGSRRCRSTTRNPNTSPRNTASSTNAVARALSTAPGVRPRGRESHAPVAVQRDADSDRGSDRAVGQPEDDAPRRSPRPQEQVRRRRGVDADDEQDHQPMPSVYQASGG